MKITIPRHAILFAVMTLTGGTATAEPPLTPPDLIKGESTGVDRNGTYNLGATGLRGWIYTRPDSYLDSEHGRTTTHGRQILVTHVGEKSPADGVVKVDDVILGTGGKPFSFDARHSIAKAIQEAEKTENGGVLKLTIWRAGKTDEVQLKLKVMGTYADTAPYNCPKSKLIFEEACKVLEMEPLEESWNGAISGLALMATGEKKFMPKVRDLAHRMSAKSLDLEKPEHQKGMVTWDWGYKNIFLCEYFLLTGDRVVLPTIREYTVALAKGQSMYGTFGHGVIPPVAKGQFRSVPPYGPVNSVGLPANIAIVLGKKCGVKDPEVDAAIERASKFFGYFVDKGIIPYGEHTPGDGCHDHNGKTAMAAVLFALQGNRPVETQFFAKMVTASYKNREIGHTGQGFSYLWGALGANTGGPAAAAAFFKQSSWHFDLVRRCDGSFTYDGGEQYGPGKTDDDTYYGKSSYSGLSPAATYVLTYSLPMKKILLTGRDASPANLLGKQDVAEAIEAGSFDLDRKQKSANELVEYFGNWSPVVRNWAAEELATRREAQTMESQLIHMAEGKDVHVAQGAVCAIGYLKCEKALPTLVRLLSHEDHWLRFKAAQSIRKLGGAASPAAADVVKAVAKTAEPLQPVAWADPIQFTLGELSAALFGGPMKDSLKDIDPKLRNLAVRVISQNPDGMARMHLRDYFENSLTQEEVEALGTDIYAAIKTPSPADTMFANEIRMGAMKALVKYHFKEGIDACIILAKSQSGHGSETRTGEIMKDLIGYGSAARPAIPSLKELIDELNDQCERGEYPAGELNNKRTGAVEDAIKAINAATTQPEMRSIGLSSAR
jgi:HEAT repeat protein